MGEGITQENGRKENSFGGITQENGRKENSFGGITQENGEGEKSCPANRTGEVLRVGTQHTSVTRR
jgi:hypothetical protein